MVLEDLQGRLDSLDASGACSSNWLSIQLVEGLLERAESENDQVARLLFEKADLHLKRLEKLQQSAESISSENTKSEFAGRLTELFESIQPDTPNFSSDSKGAEFDEYLQQQEANILQSMVGEDRLQESTQNKRDQGLLVRASRYRKHQLLQNSANRLVNIAIENSPKDPGPLNPEMLSIKSLKLLRDLSPQYLNRFVAYIDSLIWIEESAKGLSLYGSDSSDVRSAKNSGKRPKK